MVLLSTGAWTRGKERDWRSRQRAQPVQKHRAGGDVPWRPVLGQGDGCTENGLEVAGDELVKD